MYRSKSESHQLVGDRHRILASGESTIEHHLQTSPEFRSVAIPYEVRNQHIYIPGKTRHGKSTLLHAMAIQDIEIGAGVCVIDPKGDLVNSLLNWIPESRKDDCIFLSPKSPVPINFLDYTDDGEKETLVGELKYVITRGIGADSAPLMDAIITDLIYTLFNANEHPKMPTHKRATFLDIYRFLSDPDRADFIKSFVTDRELLNRWNHNFPNPKECAPTITRMTPFVRNPSLRKLFESPEPKINIGSLMDNRKILLVNLGGISESTKILATLLIAKIRQAAFRRASIPESERTPFFVYVDEFEFFQTSDFDQILSFAGGYGLRLTLANQFIGQLDSNIRQSIFGNVGSFIAFCLSPDDSTHFKHLTPEDVHLHHLPKYRAMYHIAGQRSLVKNTPPPPTAPTEAQLDIAQYIRDRMLRDYSCKMPPPPLKSSLSEGSDIPAEGEPSETTIRQTHNIPDDRREMERPGTPRKPFRPSDKRPR